MGGSEDRETTDLCCESGTRGGGTTSRTETIAPITFHLLSDVSRTSGAWEDADVPILTLDVQGHMARE